MAAASRLILLHPETGIVKEQVERGGDALSWANGQRFIELCAERAIRDFDRHVHLTRRAFSDRSFIDVASAVQLTGLHAPDALEIALRSKRYAPFVFIVFLPQASPSVRLVLALYPICSRRGRWRKALELTGHRGFQSGSGSILASTSGASATVGHAAERPVR